jgi:acetyl-CoA acetyltransferase
VRRAVVGAPSQRARHYPQAGVARIVAAVDDSSIGDSTRSGLQLQIDAVRAVCAAAKIPLSAVDGVAVSTSADLEPGQMPALELAGALGIAPTYIDSTLAGGAAPVIQIARAAMAIEQGLCTVAVVAYGSAQSSRRQRRKAGWRTESSALADKIITSTGWRDPIGVHALIAARHMYEYGTKSSDLAAVAVSQREWARLNPAAHSRDPLTVDEVLDSPVISWPLHILDCCLVTDGGAAVLLCRREDVSGGSRTARVLGFDELHTHRSLLAMHSLTSSGATRTGAGALAMAGLSVGDIQQVQLYDAFTDMPIVLLEDLGFCPKGSGGSFVASGRTRPGGDLPMNTQGGGLSHCHPGVYGLFLVVEAVTQLLGEAGERQQTGVERVLCHGVGGGAFGSHATLVLGADR